MGLFDRHPPMTEPQLTPAMKERLDDLAERTRLLEKGQKALELEWQEWFDKFRLMYARLSKRIKDAAQLDGNGSESRQDPPQSTNPRAEAYDRPYLGPTSRRNY